MLSDSMETAERVAGAMQDVFLQTDIEFNIYVSAIASDGVRIAE
jgi:hypothetical protein